MWGQVRLGHLAWLGNVRVLYPGVILSVRWSKPVHQITSQSVRFLSDLGSKGIPRRKLHSDAIRGRSAETEERSGRALRLRGYPRRSVHIIFSSALVGRIRGNGPCSTVDHAIDKHGRQDKSIACRWLPCCACADPRCYLIRRRGGGHKDEAGAGKRGRLRVCHRGGGCHRIIEASLLLSLTPSFFFFFF